MSRYASSLLPAGRHRPAPAWIRHCGRMRPSHGPIAHSGAAAPPLSLYGDRRGERAHRRRARLRAADPLSELQDAVGLTRATLVRTLTKPGHMDEFAVDPMTFLSQVTGKIEAVKSQVMAKWIKYTGMPEGQWYTMDILAVSDLRAYLDQNVWKLLHHKSLYDYVVYDSSSIEQPYAVQLDRSAQVKVYAKLPRRFKIDTLLGSYNPDWAYVEEGDDGKHRVYFVVETKGKQRGENRPTEEAKIDCAEKHFEALELGGGFHYEVETKYHYATV
jgi:type III restriction enzyme